MQATKEHVVSLEDAVVIEHRPDGKIKFHRWPSAWLGAGAAGGALWGGLIGLIFLAPLVGIGGFKARPWGGRQDHRCGLNYGSS